MDSEHEQQQEASNSATHYTRNEDTATLPTRRPGQHPDDEERATIQAVFLEEFARRANVTDACEVAGVDRSTIYRWLDLYPEFAQRWEVAEQKANDVLRREAHRRAVEGVPEYVVSLSKIVRDENGEPLIVRKYDSQLLQMLMRARMPEYRDSKHVDVNQNTNINVSQQSLTLDLRGMSAEELVQVRQIAEGMKQREQARLEQGKSEAHGRN